MQPDSTAAMKTTHEMNFQCLISVAAKKKNKKIFYILGGICPRPRVTHYAILRAKFVCVK
jgi:hypothetical protein